MIRRKNKTERTDVDADELVVGAMAFEEEEEEAATVLLAEVVAAVGVDELVVVVVVGQYLYISE